MARYTWPVFTPTPLDEPGGFLGFDNDDRGGTWKGILLKAHIDAVNWGAGEVGTIGHQIWMNAR